MYKPYVKQKVPKSQNTSTKEYFENLKKNSEKSHDGSHI